MKTSPALPPVIVLGGDDQFLRHEHLRDIERAVFAGEDPGMGFIRIDPASLGSEAMATILDEARTASMFAPGKLVVVDPADPLLKKAEGEEPDDRMSNREILENYVEAVTQSPEAAASVLVLAFASWPKNTRLHKALDKLGAVRWCLSIKAPQAGAWIVRRAREGYGKAIDPAAAQRLADLIGPDLQRLDNELAKLSLYEPDAPAIRQAAVDALVGFQHEQQIWDMLGALAARQAPLALKKIDELWALEPKKMDYSATAAVIFWLNQVLKARELVDRRMPDAMIGTELKLWPADRAQKVIALARSWGLPGAVRWSDELLKMDLANKTSLGEARLNLEKFVVLLCAG